MAKQKDSLDQVADELYGLAPADFTEARDALVKRLRADKERELANEVKALRKPTLAAWALNQLVRHRKKDVDKLLAAGTELRKAQEKLVAGGDRSGFQRAGAKERELVAQLARDASAIAAEAGAGSSQGLEEKLAATLHAAAIDEETAEELAAGRVLRERQPVAGFGGLELAPQPPKPPRKSAKPAKADKEDAQRREREQAEAREDLQAARLEERKAGRERDAAAKAAARAADRAAKAEERATEAGRRLEEARGELDEAEKQQREADERYEKATQAVDAAEKKLS